VAHIILFENINFHGARKHVVHDEPNLNASDDNFFNDPSTLPYASGERIWGDGRCPAIRSSS
jgi:hypothetical protein